MSLSNSTPETLTELMQNVRETREYLKEIHDRFAIHGTSLSQMYLLMKCRAFLDRLDRLLALDLRLAEPFFCFEEMKTILIQSKNQHEVLSFLKDSARVIVQKVISRTSEMGEHYISRTPREYFKLFAKACGGGFVMSSTVILKVLISFLPLAAFPMGFASGINFSLSFVIIYLVGFTVATKQPAATAPLLAQKISERKDQSWTELIDEIVNVFRSQFVSVAGNIFLVVPSVALFHYIYVAIRQKNFLSQAKASHLAEALDIFGPSWIYAAFTGFLLFFSSVAAGWADQWFQFNRVGDRILLQPRLLSFFGKARLKRLTVFLTHNFAAVAANVILGMLLGLVPEILGFLGIPLDVRHVTLSSGTLMMAFLGGAEENLCIRAAVMILFVGALNVIFSFVFSFFFALFGKSLRRKERSLIYRLTLKRFADNPLSFFFPVRTK